LDAASEGPATSTPANNAKGRISDENLMDLIHSEAKSDCQAGSAMIDPILAEKRR